SVARINEKIIGKEMVIAGNFTKAEGEAIVAALNPDSRLGKSDLEQQHRQPASQGVQTRPSDSRAKRIQTLTLVQDGRLLLEMGKLDEAEGKLKEAFKRDPDNK